MGERGGGVERARTSSGVCQVFSEGKFVWLLFCLVVDVKRGMLRLQICVHSKAQICEFV